MRKVAIQGTAGSFHEAAARSFFGNKPTQLVPCDTFRSVFTTLQNNDADVAVVAIENSLYGSIHDVYDHLVTTHAHIVGEVLLPVHQQLIVLSDTVKLSDISEIYSHPAALDQCRNWLHTHLPNAELIEYYDTAGAVEYIATKKLDHAAAIASTQAAHLHKLVVIAKNIEDDPSNTTRFIVIAKEKVQEDEANKASLLLITSHQPGALHAALGIFAANNCNLTKIESRPIRGQKFRYQFIVDVQVSRDQLITISTELEQQNCRLTLLGHYRSSSI